MATEGDIHLCIIQLGINDLKIQRTQVQIDAWRPAPAQATQQDTVKTLIRTALMTVSDVHVGASVLH
ncbi:hypothetical protein BG74_08185 [Sodalis-like endosymbiont of Proechinophthirus fluctus]|uniref:hypothetical protein n=1 Tax=Sodalis-like endosymbiont of Proechinophthirus fluctus TaxID=1462730 RepID=UPI0007A8D7EA|nr:hypothetical protein [Sodalis-like endosymbiont of Proechinophthirus fluctus]KYP95749.1 hypothetical protein BG74_08185 [Sodalis-like endosymbiont of Proechinophthirus fluctus]